MNSIFSVDVEDWFHILDIASVPPIEQWKQMPSRVEKNFMVLLDIFSEKKVNVTCFFLGWVAEMFPHLVREAYHRGHEIASHGYAHKLVYEITQREFLDDTLRSRDLLENIIGAQIHGYRSAGFSVTAEVPWYFESLANAGFKYDSSIFPAARGHGGMRNGHYAPYKLSTESGVIIEFPITVASILGKPMCFFGGGYLRLFPYWLVRRMAKKVQKEGRTVNYYIHPRDIDPNQPRLPMNVKRKFKSYVNLKTTKHKVDRILTENCIWTFKQFIDDNEELWS